MSDLLHATAIIHPGAQLGPGTKVGAFSIIDANVRTGAKCEIQDHVVIRGNTTLGDEVRVFPFAAIGLEPQHMGYKGEETTVCVGNRVTLRESVTIHRGTVMGGGKTLVGDDSLIMAYTHIAHDCIVGSNVILANAIQLAGHVVIGSHTTIGGQSAVAQYCRVGEHCYVGGGSILRKDLPPFLLGKGNDFRVQGINQVGLSRSGFTPEQVQQLKKAFKILYLQKLTVTQALERMLTELGESEPVHTFANFVKGSKLGFIR